MFTIKKASAPRAQMCQVRYTVASAKEGPTEYLPVLRGQATVLRQWNREVTPVLRQDVCLEVERIESSQGGDGGL